MYFLVFHGKERYNKPQHHSEGHDSDAHHEEEQDAHGHHGLAPGETPHEAPLVVTLPLILLAIPSVINSYVAIGPMLHGDFFNNVIFVGENQQTKKKQHKENHSTKAKNQQAFTSM